MYPNEEKCEGKAEEGKGETQKGGGGLKEGKDNLSELQLGEDQRTKGGQPEGWQEVTTS